MNTKELVPIDNKTYNIWLQHLVEEIDRQRLNAVMQLNAATLSHYWWIGNDILSKQKEQGWGAKVIDMASAACTNYVVSSYIADTQSERPKHTGILYRRDCKPRVEPRRYAYADRRRILQEETAPPQQLCINIASDSQCLGKGGVQRPLQFGFCGYVESQTRT